MKRSWLGFAKGDPEPMTVEQRAELDARIAEKDRRRLARQDAALEPLAESQRNRTRWSLAGMRVGPFWFRRSRPRRRR